MRRREIWVGSSTVKTVLGSRFASRFLDHYLATKGYDGQQTDDLPMPADRRDNLYRPVPGDHGAHGAFDARALETSKESELRRGVERMVGALPADGADGGARDRGASRRL